jgi:hypothetical protein
MTEVRGPSGGRGLIRSLSRRGTRTDKAPPVARLNLKFKEPTICDKCGAIYIRRTWRRDHHLSAETMRKAAWAVCPSCRQVARHEHFGRVLLTGDYVAPHLDAITRRINNVGRRAAVTQPERKLVAMQWKDEAYEVLTTSQKLAHRIAHELEKAFGGHAGYSWSDGDGGLLATWRRKLSAAERARTEGL